jgi:hypothetical protein
MERIGKEIERELARGGSRDVIPLAAVTEVWSDTVGATVARQAWPLRIGRDGTLHIATSSSTWAHELDLLQDEILEGLSHRLGAEAPTRLRFAVGPIPEPAAAVGSGPERPSVDVPPEVVSEAARVAARIDDPELRALVSRAARASLFRARSGRSFW